MSELEPYLRDEDFTLYCGDSLEVLRELEPGSIDCCITSPPYWGLRDYGSGDAQIGVEQAPEEYVEKLVAVFAEVRRALAPHGTLWLNLGDSYAGAGYQNDSAGYNRVRRESGGKPKHLTGTGLKPKNLVGIPWRAAFALQADGWYLRSDIIWAKPNPMPESTTDRPTKAHEYVFLLSKEPRYYFDQELVREEPKPLDAARAMRVKQGRTGDERDANANEFVIDGVVGANIRTVWWIQTRGYEGVHFATYPEELVRRALLAGCPGRVCRVCGKPSERMVERQNAVMTSPRTNQRAVEVPGGDRAGFYGLTARTVGWTDCGHNDWRAGVVLDPFMGSGTTAFVARAQQRHAVGIDISAEYCEAAAKRLRQLSLLAHAVSAGEPELALDLERDAPPAQELEPEPEPEPEPLVVELERDAQQVLFR